MNNFMKKLPTASKFLIAALLVCSAANAVESTTQLPALPKKEENVIELKITKNSANTVEAQIINIDDAAKKNKLEKVSVIGTKIHHEATANSKAVTEISWNKASLADKTTELSSSLKSKVVSSNGLAIGDKFKAKGDEKQLIESIEKLSIKEAPEKKPVHKKSAKTNSNSSGSNSSDPSNSGMASNTSKLSSLSAVRQSAASISSTTTSDPGTEVTSTTGCSWRVDYQLNKVFIQERTTLDGKETRACHDSATSFTLQKDYNICPITVNTSTSKVTPNFQYFFLDAEKGTNAVDSCQPDNSRSTTLAITKSYSCADYVNIVSKVAYAQFKQTYKDSDQKDVLLTDCAIDSSKSYPIVEDTASCSIRHLFDAGYSIQQSRLYYTKDDETIVVQSCADTSKKYSHTTTSDTCTPIINNNQVTTFSRKYIAIDGVRQYISDCTPLNSNVTIQSENCTINPYTHDLVAGQSFRNKNYFYLDGNNNRVEVSSCTKSTESFAQLEDSSVCTETNDDVNMATTVYSRKYINVDNNKVYITACAAVSPTIAYREIGYKWVSEYNLSSASVTAGGVSDNIYLGSKQGEEVNTSDYGVSAGYWTRLVNQFIIGNYSTIGKCATPTSISYSGNAVDLSYSNQSSITYDNYVNQVTSSPKSYKMCQAWSLISKTCTNLYSVPQSENNTLYYQRCTNYKCPIYKLVKKPILQRKNGTEFVNTAGTLANKYVCGESGLSGSTVYY